MIRIVDEEEIRSITPGKREPSLSTRNIHRQFEELKSLLAIKEAEIERLHEGAGSISNELKLQARSDVLSKDLELKDEEVVRLRDRHIRDVEIIARLHDDIDELKVQVESLEHEIVEVHRKLDHSQHAVMAQEPRGMSPQYVQADIRPSPRAVGPGPRRATFIESQPGNEPPIEGTPIASGYEGGPVVSRPAQRQAGNVAQIIEAVEVPFDEQEIPEAVVIPIDEEGRVKGGAPIRYRPLD